MMKSFNSFKRKYWLNLTMIGLLINIFAFTSLMTAQNSLPKQANVIGHWALDNNAKDISGNGHDGVERLVTYSDDAKVGSSSVVFSSTPEENGSGISLPLDIAQSDIKTLSFWMNRAGEGLGGSSESYIIRRSEHFYVKIKNSGVLRLALPGAEGEIKTEVADLIADSTWYHIAGVIDGNTIKLYVDGKLVKTSVEAQVQEDGDYFGLGSGFDSPWASFNGKMDDVILWNVALDSTEIKSIMTYVPAPGQAVVSSPVDAATDVNLATILGWTAGEGSDSSLVYFGTSNTPALVKTQRAVDTYFNPGELTPNTTYYWKVDSKNAGGITEGALWSFTTGSGVASNQLPKIDNIIAHWTLDNNAKDVSGNGKDGVERAMTYSEDGKEGSHCAVFSSTPEGDGSGISLPLDITQADIKTISFWMNRAGEGLGGSSESYIIRRSGHFYVKIKNSGVLRLAVPGDDGEIKAEVSGIVPNNIWVHVVGVIDGNKAKLYVNGSVGVTKEGTVVQEDGEYFGLGSGFNSPWASFNGKMDDVILWNVALDSMEVQNLMQYTTMPGQAVVLSPVDAATDVNLATILGWTAGESADSSLVYFGTSNTPALVKTQRALDNYFNPGELTPNTTYYWKVDSKNAAGITEGTLWSFTTGSGKANGGLPKVDNIIAHWTLDNNAKDVSGNGKDGVERAMTYSEDGKEGSHCAVFSSTPEGDGSGISLPLDITQSDIKTLSFWMNRAGEGLGGSSESYIIRRSGHFYVKIKNSGLLRLAVPGDDGEIKAEVSGIVPNDTWVHVVAVIDGNKAKLYINGSVGKTKEGTVVQEDGEYFGLGSGFNSPWASFNGKMDDVILWNVALDSMEVQNLMQYTTMPGQAVVLSPVDVATDVNVTTILGWTVGEGSDSSLVYFGTSNTPELVRTQRALDNYFNPGELAPNTTYYWKVDSKNAAGITEGALWSFTTGSGVASSPLPKADNIIAHWTLDNNAKDVSGNGKDGVERAMTYSEDAKVGSHCAVFSSTPEGDGSGISLPLDITQADIKTLSFWMNRAGEGLGGSSESYIIRRSGHFYVKIKNSGLLRLAVPGDDGEIKAEVSGIVPNDTWVHVVGVIDGNKAKLYINGSVGKTKEGTVVQEDGEYFGLGSGFNSPWASFNGKMDDVILWNVALDSMEVQDILKTEGTTEVEESELNNLLPTEFSIGNYPNPFNPSTTINYNLPEAGNVKVQIFDILGRLVTELVNNKEAAGFHNVIWNGQNSSGVQTSSGMYICRVKYNNQVKTAKMLLLK